MAMFAALPYDTHIITVGDPPTQVLVNTRRGKQPWNYDTIRRCPTALEFEKAMKIRKAYEALAMPFIREIEYRNLIIPNRPPPANPLVWVRGKDLNRACLEFSNHYWKYFFHLAYTVPDRNQFRIDVRMLFLIRFQIDHNQYDVEEFDNDKQTLIRIAQVLEVCSPILEPGDNGGRINWFGLTARVSALLN